jgi:hypothetical protein
MIWQLHWQFGDGHTECKSQEQSYYLLDNEYVRTWVDTVVALYPLPEGAMWLMLNADDERFDKGFRESI